MSFFTLCYEPAGLNSAARSGMMLPKRPVHRIPTTKPTLRPDLMESAARFSRKFPYPSFSSFQSRDKFWKSTWEIQSVLKFQPWPPELLEYFEPVPEPTSADERFSGLTTAQRRLFEIADEKLGPPPELLEYFDPVPEPGSAETGPPIPPEMALQILPAFEPFVRGMDPSAERPENN